MLGFLRDYLIGLIDIAVERDQIDLFEIHVKLALQTLLEVLEIRELREKTKDYEFAISHLWKTLASICKQNFYYRLEQR